MRHVENLRQVFHGHRAYLKLAGTAGADAVPAGGQSRCSNGTAADPVWKFGSVPSAGSAAEGADCHRHSCGEASAGSANLRAGLRRREPPRCAAELGRSRCTAGAEGSHSRSGLSEREEPYCENSEAFPGKLGYEYLANTGTSQLPLTCRNALSEFIAYPYMCIPISRLMFYIWVCKGKQASQTPAELLVNEGHWTGDIVRRNYLIQRNKAPEDFLGQDNRQTEDIVTLA
ncbi:uncharacterized protein [Chamaea fasciata]|uniref:uncharacterized protein n=1 Tax=Chamaea fasciata TaxID=190680 RepID=UPI00336AB0C7